jgi:flagellar protein FlgJ
MTAPVSPVLLAAAPESTPKDAAGAAKQFEALLIGQMLRSVREEASDDDDDKTASTMLDVADQQFSQVLANNGGLGLARMIASGLQERS